MSDLINQRPPESSPHGKHEVTDVSPWSIGMFVIGLAGMILIVLWLTGWVFWRFDAWWARFDPPRSPFSNVPHFAGPHLQANPTAEFTRFRDEENQRMTRYGWIDRPQGVVSIPIESAIKILSERGIPEPVGMTEAANPEGAKP